MRLTALPPIPQRRRHTTLPAAGPAPAALPGSRPPANGRCATFTEILDACSTVFRPFMHLFCSRTQSGASQFSVTVLRKLSSPQSCCHSHDDGANDTSCKLMRPEVPTCWQDCSSQRRMHHLININKEVGNTGAPRSVCDEGRQRLPDRPPPQLPAAVPPQLAL